jgi:hypothetical protein
METMKLNTTDLLKFNLTDFLDEVKQDLKYGKYNFKLADLQVISEIDLHSFLQKITNDFDVEKLKMTYNDICHWEWLIGGNDEDKLPYITKQIKRMIEKKLYDIIYNDTIDKLRNDKKYLNTDLEGLDTFYFGGDLTKIIEITYGAYSDAKMDFTHSLQPQLSTIKQKPTHFTRSFTPDEQRKLFNELTKWGFLPKTTNKNHFNFVFGSTAISDDEKPFSPLKWEKSQALLAYFVFNLFSETDGNFWNITAKCFTVGEKEPNIGVMTAEQSKVKNKEKDPPKGHQKIDDIIMSLA